MQQKNVVCLLLILILSVWLLPYCKYFSLNNLLQAQEVDFMSPGKWLVSLQLSKGSVRTADTTGRLSSIYFPYDQNGVELGVSYGISNDWAITLSGNYGFSNYKFIQPDIVIDDRVKTSSWSIRGGADVYFAISDKFYIYMGPGLMFTRAKIKQVVKQTGMPTDIRDNPYTNSMSLSGRLGGLLKLANHFGLYGNFGQQYSYSWFNVTSNNIKNEESWWTTSLDAHMGIALFFGGGQ